MKLFVKYLLVLVSDMLNREMLGFGILLRSVIGLHLIAYQTLMLLQFWECSSGLLGKALCSEPDK